MTGCDVINRHSLHNYSVDIFVMEQQYLAILAI